MIKEIHRNHDIILVNGKREKEKHDEKNDAKRAKASQSKEKSGHQTRARPV